MGVLSKKRCFWAIFALWTELYRVNPDLLKNETVSFLTAVYLTPNLLDDFTIQLPPSTPIITSIRPYFPAIFILAEIK